MKKILSGLVLILITNTAFSITGEDVMRKAEAQQTPVSTHILVELIIVEANKSKKSRIVEMWGDDSSDISKEIMVFRAPASVKNTRFLIKEDNKWIFMPALGKVRRIAASDGNSSFMGTEFTYDDMSTREIDDDTHTLIKEEKFMGYNCYVVESTPKNMADATYNKRVSWIIKDNDILIPAKIELYKKGELNKVLTVSDLEKIDGYWIPGTTKMENVLNNRSSLIINKKIELNKKINPAIFEKRFLTTGKVK